MMEIPFLDLQKINARYAERFQTSLQDVLKAGWFLQGEYTRKFERAFAAFSQTRYSVGVANGLDALTLILQAQKEIAGWRDGDEVIVPAHTFVASALAIVQAKLTPVFVDVSLDDFLLDVDQAEKWITPRTRAIMPVHLYGRCCDMERISELATRYQLFVVEDAAQAHGATLMTPKGDQGKAAGSWGNAAAFSFYPGKNLGALGDGGAVVSQDSELIQQIRVLANYGAERKYNHTHLGKNSRLDEMQAAFLLSKLTDLNTENQYRQTVAHRYLTEIRNQHILLPYAKDGMAHLHSVFHIFPVRTMHREALQRHLRDHGISTLIHYPTPLHQQPALKPFVVPNECYPHAEKIAAQELSLPISPVLTTDEIDYVIKTLNSFQL